MFLYYLVLILSLLYYYINITGKINNSKVFFICYMSYVAIFVGLGDMIGGYDRYIYGAIFDDIVNNFHLNHAIFLESVRGQEYGYIILNLLFAHVTSNRYMFIFLFTALMYFLYIKAIIEHINNYPLTCIVFLGFFFYYTITYMREALAIGIAWQSIKYLMERKPLPFFIIVFIAYSIHNSAIVFAPLYFVKPHKYSKETITRFLILCLLIGLSPLPKLVLGGLGDITGKSERLDEYAADLGNNGFTRIIEVGLFIWMLFSCYYQIAKFKKKDLIMLNIYLAFCGILLLTMRFGQGRRMGWYFYIGIFYIISDVFIKKKRLEWRKYLFIILCVLSFIRITVAWAFNLGPYKTFLTNGYPCGERIIYEENEYDENYTKDKLYRPLIDFK